MAQTKKICKNCMYWTPTAKDDGKVGFGDCDCDKFVEDTFSIQTYQTDWLVYADFEGYAASFTTGENFGCIHWVKRPLTLIVTATPIQKLPE
jgi:hypothetical protein